MPVTIPYDLPARHTLEKENIFVISDRRAVHQDIRPLRIAILNLMPTKIATETQLLRLLSNTSLQVEITLLRVASYEPRNTPSEHLSSFYSSFKQERFKRFDGLIITGAPVETLDFEAVAYWRELIELLDWSLENVFSVLHVCWGAQAALYRHYGIQKHQMNSKLSGVFNHHVLNRHELILRGFDDSFLAPHSRHTEIYEKDILANPDLSVLAISDEAGVYLVADRARRRFFVTGHPEYDRLTLKDEYERDLEKGLAIELPRHYFPGDNPKSDPPMTWRSHAHMLYANWLNYCVYQRTPYDLNTLPRGETPIEA